MGFKQSSDEKGNCCRIGGGGGVLFVFMEVKWPAGKLSTEGQTDGVPDRPSGTLLVLRVRRFHGSTAWPFAPVVEGRLQVYTPVILYCARHFPWTSILPLLKSSKISALQKGAVWEEASLFHKRLLDFLPPKTAFL